MLKKLKTDAEYQKMYDLSLYAFNSVDRESKRKAFIKAAQWSHNYGVMDGDILTSKIMSYPFLVSIFGVPMEMSGIGNVATYPEYRGKGGIRKLFQKLFHDLHKTKTPLSYLAPFSEAFYRKYGYEPVIDEKTITIPSSVMGQLPRLETSSCFRVTWEDTGVREAMISVHNETLGKLHGNTIRPDWWWDYRRAYYVNQKLMLVRDEMNEVSGYLIYETVGDTFIAHEAAYLSSKAYNSVLSFVAAHAGSVAKIISKKAFNDSIKGFFPESREIESISKSYMMARIVSFSDFIEKYPFIYEKSARELVITVKDEMCPWNDGQFKLKVEKGQGTLVKILEEGVTSDISGTIGKFTQLFLGVYDVSEFFFHDWLEGSEAGLAHILPSGTPVLHDYF